MIDGKNLYEKFRDKELPEELQRHLEASISFCKDQNEAMFKAGFMAHANYDKYREQLQGES
jgi:hypothetical protein